MIYALFEVRFGANMNKWLRVVLASLLVGLILSAVSTVIQVPSNTLCGPSKGTNFYDDTAGVSLYDHYGFDRGLPFHFYTTCKCVSIYHNNQGCESVPPSHEWLVLAGLADIVIWSLPVFLLQLPFTIRKKK